MSPFVGGGAFRQQVKVKTQQENELQATEEANATLHCGKERHGSVKTKEPANRWYKHCDDALEVQPSNQFPSIVNIKVVTVECSQEQVYQHHKVIAKVVVPHASSCEDAVMVPHKHAGLAVTAMMSPRR